MAIDTHSIQYWRLHEGIYGLSRITKSYIYEETTVCMLYIFEVHQGQNLEYVLLRQINNAIIFLV